MKIKDFKDLIVWQKAKELAIVIYKTIKDFPRNEQFGLTSQIKRAVISIPSNIAEGYARQHTGEFIQFVYIAMGSAAELETQIIISKELCYLKEEAFNKIISDLKEIQRMLKGARHVVNWR